MLVFTRVTPVFIMQNTPFNRYSVALTVLVPGVQPGPGERSGGHILGGVGGTVNRQADASVNRNCWLWGRMGADERPEQRPKGRERRPDVQNGGLVKSRHSRTGKGQAAIETLFPCAYPLVDYEPALFAQRSI